MWRIGSLSRFFVSHGRNCFADFLEYPPCFFSASEELMRRVVITGVGVVSPHGIGTAPFWNALLEGKSSISKQTRFDPSAFACQVAGLVPPFKVQEYVP